MKKLLFIALLGSIALSARAQTNNDGKGKFNIGIEAGSLFKSDNYIPSSGHNRYNDMIFGASVKYEHPLAKNLFLTGSIGYMRVTQSAEEEDASGFSGYNYLPVKVGLKYYFYKGFFAEAQVGEAFKIGSRGANYTIYTPSVGYTFKNGLELGIKYDGGRSYNNIGGRLSFRF